MSCVSDRIAELAAFSTIFPTFVKDIEIRVAINPLHKMCLSFRNVGKQR